MVRGCWYRWGMGSLICTLLLIASGCGDQGGSAPSTDTNTSTSTSSTSNTSTTASTSAGSPAVSGTPATLVQVGQPYSFTPISNDPNGQGLAYSIQNKPSWATFSVSTGSLTGTPTSADVGEYPDIQISAATSSSSVALQPFTIDVTAASTATLDTYGGVAAVKCSNPNGSSYFGLATVGNHKVLCDPSGHPYFGRGFYVFNDVALGNDESGNSYSTYISVKYGSANTTYTWDAAEVARLKAWDFNMIGPNSSAYALASWPWTGGGTNPNKVPFVLYEDICYNSWSNRFGYGSAPVKDVLSTASPFWKIGYTGFGGVTDYEDPAWVTYARGFLSATGDSYIANVIQANPSDKSYLIGVFGCDSDFTHGFNAGPDFATAPFTDKNDFRLSYEVALGSPVEWASTHQHQIYADATVYSKKAFYTQLASEYGSISALNTAWRSSYTTFGTSGTCYGSTFPNWICPNPSAAAAVGAGNGTTLTFSATLTTTVSANSVGIFVGGTLVGGDGGDGPFSGSSGTIYGPNLSGSINYSTGAMSITFAPGKAPASGAAITAAYIANGWGVGTGLMDEDGRASHQSWTGTNVICIDGIGAASACNQGGSSYASSGMVSDLNALDIALAGTFGSVYTSAINAHLPGALFLGPETFGSWNVPPNRYVIEGMAPYLGVGTLYGSGAAISQAELDFIHQYGGDLALGLGSYQSANLDSAFAWPGSNCTRSGTTVTCTLLTLQDFSTSLAIDTSCTDQSYNVKGVYPTLVGAGTVVYSAPTAPNSSSATCNIAFDDALQTNAYSTMSARGAAVGAQVQALPTQSYTSDGVFPYVMWLQWQWSDKESEKLSWGIVDTRDNAYNGVETTTAKIPCAAPSASFTCGGELRGGFGSDGLTPLINANSALDNALAAFSGITKQ